ncbi:halocyanin domain-containing protein [Halocatena halophila]|uniref:halocyanin domain-containing protein n=1 Tax=Halocatena halophila TaxID=2814576 RepID=UPI002ED48EF6
MTENQTTQTDHQRTRRAVLGSIGTTLLASTLAGCLSGDEQSEEPESIDAWLSDTDSFDGVTDRTGASSVVVDVGVSGNNGSNGFTPVAIAISPDTTIQWNWVDGYHNVVDTADAFDSGEPESDATFEHTFTEPGTYTYYCSPHRQMGMKGAVVVRSEGSQ